jgi:hypothetical protein
MGDSIDHRLSEQGMAESQTPSDSEDVYGCKPVGGNTRLCQFQGGESGHIAQVSLS